MRAAMQRIWSGCLPTLMMRALRGHLCRHLQGRRHLCRHLQGPASIQYRGHGAVLRLPRRCRALLEEAFTEGCKQIAPSMRKTKNGL